jgi:sialic acid synthase SpsE
MEKAGAARRRRGIEFMSSPFSAEAVAMLEDIGISRYKIPSGEVSNLPMLEASPKPANRFSCPPA